MMWSILGTRTMVSVHIYEGGEVPNRKHDVNLQIQDSPARWFGWTPVSHGVEQGAATRRHEWLHMDKRYFSTPAADSVLAWGESSIPWYPNMSQLVLSVSRSTGRPSVLAGLPVSPTLCQHRDWPCTGWGCPLYHDPLTCCTQTPWVCWGAFLSGMLCGNKAVMVPKPLAVPGVPHTTGSAELEYCKSEVTPTERMMRRTAWVSEG